MEMEAQGMRTKNTALCHGAAVNTGRLKYQQMGHTASSDNAPEKANGLSGVGLSKPCRGWDAPKPCSFLGRNILLSQGA